MATHTLIQTSKALEETCTPVVESSSVVGIDAEWPPYESSGPPKACLLQIACLVLDEEEEEEEEARRYVFVIDIRSISEEGDIGVRALKDVFRRLVKNHGCLKIGHSLDVDIKAVCCALDIPIQGVVVTYAVDVKHIFTRLWHMRAPGLHGTCKNKGLSGIMEAVLGVTLDKSLQCSEWGTRPLTDSQILYAANDASCLLDLFLAACCMYDGKAPGRHGQGNYCLTTWTSDVVEDACVVRTGVLEFGQEWTWSRYGKLVISKRTEFWNKQHSAPRKKKGGGKKCMVHTGGVLPEHVPWNIGTDEPKFICDDMLQGLAKQLRLWGVDCEMVPILQAKTERFVTHRRLVEIAEEESRVILTKDAVLYTRKISDRMYFVTSNTKQEQTEEVLKRFNVHVSLESLMSRCSACNGQFKSEPSRADQLPQGHGLPDAVLQQIDEFWVCSQCDSHVYWKGGQYKRSMDKLTQDFERMFSSNKKEST